MAVWSLIQGGFSQPTQGTQRTPDYFQSQRSQLTPPATSPITLVSVGTVGTTGVAPGLPAGRQNGDLLLLTAAGSFGAPSGWSTLSGGSDNQFWRRVDGTETSITTYALAQIACFRGATQNGSPFLIGTKTVVATTTAAATSITTTFNDELVLLSAYMQPSATSGITESWLAPTNGIANSTVFTATTDNGSTQGYGIGLWSNTQAMAGATGTETVSSNQGGTGVSPTLAVRFIAITPYANLVEVGTAAGAGAVTASDVYGVIETAIVAADGATTATDTYGVIETATVAAAGAVTASDVYTPAAGNTYTETATVAADASVTATDLWQAIETGSVAAAATVTTTDTQQEVETATVAASASVTASDASQLLETATVAASASVTGADVFHAVETSTVLATGSVTATDIGGTAETATVAAAGSVTSADVWGAVELGQVVASATVTATDQWAGLETGTVVGSGDVTSVDEVVHVFFAPIDLTGVPFNEIPLPLDGSLTPTGLPTGAFQPFLSAAAPVFLDTAYSAQSLLTITVNNGGTLIRSVEATDGSFVPTPLAPAATFQPS